MEKTITVTELIAALKPFADYAIVYGEEHRADSPSVWDQVPDENTALRGTCAQHRITVGDLRAVTRLYWTEDGEPITAKQVA